MEVSFGKMKNIAGLSDNSGTLFLLLAVSNLAVNAYDPLDPTANITITWDVVSWTDDGYVASVTIDNYQQYRHVQDPRGWTLGWTWPENEVIWSIAGAQATEQGDCSQFQNPIPHSCNKNPNIVDLLPGASYTDQFRNCCKGGVLAAWAQDPANSMSSFRITVGRGNAGHMKTSNMTLQHLPKNFTFMTPGPGYSCSSPQIVKPTQFPASDGRRNTQAHKTWKLSCTYSQFLASKAPSCCVSFSSFYSETMIPCSSCSCNCQGNSSDGLTCVRDDSQVLSLGSNPLKNNDLNRTLVLCRRHMCPVNVHWHVKTSYRDYWRAKITVNNFDYSTNFSQWNIVAQHPDFKRMVAVYSFNYKILPSYGNTNDTSMFWGITDFNDMLMQAEPGLGLGVVRSEILFGKDKRAFTFRNGYAFPHKLYFNGDNCVMPLPDSYPRLPNGSPAFRSNKKHYVASGFVALTVAALWYILEL